MDPHISLAAGPGDLTSRIYRQLLDAILDGRLRTGERLPPTRELAGRLSVARNTVMVAYERLVAEGYLVSRVGAGTFVSAQPLATRGRRAAPSGGLRPRPGWTATAIEVDDRAPAYDFGVGTPDPALFPLTTWRRLVAAELRRSTLFAHREPAGHPALRAAIARYVGISRSVRADACDVLVTAGAQQALDLVGRVLITPGDVVAVEEPGYPPARSLFASLGARVVGVGVNAEGLDVTALPAAARLVYVTPSHQFPLGTPMSLARRAALLDWANRHDAAIVEDDYDSEFRFGDRPLDPLHSLDHSGRVLYVGTFSKTLLPVLRLGFLVAPPSLRPALAAAKQLTDWHGDPVTQAALARLIDSGELARHVRKATRVYAERHRLILDELPAGLTAVPSAAGLHLCTLLAPGVTYTPTADVAVENLAAYHTREPRPGLVLGYGAIPTDRIPAGLRLIAQNLR